MAILIDQTDRILVQGITGNVGSSWARRLLKRGTPVVGGVTPGKGGQRVADLPVFDSVYQARTELGATASVVTVPAPFVKDAVLEAVDAGLSLVVVYTEGTPVHDALQICAFVRARGAVLLGPNSAGCVSPGLANLSDLNDANLRRGRVGIVSKSGTLTYEVIDGLNGEGLGQSTVVCLGGDPVIGTHYAEVLERFEADPETDAVVLVGEIGGRAEFRAAEMVHRMSKPVVAYVAGRWAPRERRMGHAGALVERGHDTAEAKIVALRNAGAIVAEQVIQVGSLVARALGRVL